MSRSRIVSSLAAASLGIAMLGACSTESLAERAVGFGLEQAVEGDQDINLDFDSDGAGGFSISTDEGDFAINFDEDNGGIAFNTEEGEGSISFTEDGLIYDTDEGEGVISFDEENGSISFDSDEGEGTVTLGSASVPANWPASIPLPSSLEPGSATFSDIDGGDTRVTSGVFEHDPAEDYAARVASSLADAGWEQNVVTEDGDFFMVVMMRGADQAQIISSGGSTTVVFGIEQ